MWDGEGIVRGIQEPGPIKRNNGRDWGNLQGGQPPESKCYRGDIDCRRQKNEDDERGNSKYGRLQSLRDEEQTPSIKRTLRIIYLY